MARIRGEAMTYKLTPGPEVGKWKTAILSEVRHDATGGRGGVWLRGSKAPIAIVLIHGEDMTLCDVQGRRLDIAVMESLYPGLRDELQGHSAKNV